MVQEVRCFCCNRVLGYNERFYLIPDDTCTICHKIIMDAMEE